MSRVCGEFVPRIMKHLWKWLYAENQDNDNQIRKETFWRASFYLS